MALHRLLFDTANMAESANVGAYLRDSNGALLTSTLVGADQALDVNLVQSVVLSVDDNSGSLTVDAVDLDIRNLVFATDKVDVSGSSITVSSTDLDIRDLTHVSDSVKIGDGTDFLAIDASGNIGVTDAGGSLTVDASQLDIDDLNATDDAVQSWLRDGAGTALTSTLVGADQALDVNVVALTAADVDIRDLTHVSDSVKIGDGTDFLAIAADGSIAVTDNGGSLTVDASQLDIDDLNATDDAVSAWLKDGSGTSITSTGGALDVNIASSDIEISMDLTHDTAILADTETVTTTSGALVTSVLAARERLFMYNNGNKIVYIGESGVTTGSGFPLFPGSILEAAIGPAVAVHAVAESGSQDIRILQLS